MEALSSTRSTTTRDACGRSFECEPTIEVYDRGIKVNRFLAKAFFLDDGAP